jgi:hypothetical protein
MDMGLRHPVEILTLLLLIHCCTAAQLQNRSNSTAYICTGTQSTNWLPSRRAAPRAATASTAATVTTDTADTAPTADTHPTAASAATAGIAGIADTATAAFTAATPPTAGTPYSRLHLQLQQQLRIGLYISRRKEGQLRS